MTPSLRTLLASRAMMSTAALMAALLCALLILFTASNNLTIPVFFWILLAAAAVAGGVAHVRIAKAAMESVGDIDVVTRVALAFGHGELDRRVNVEALHTSETRELGQAINAVAAATRRDIDEMKRLARVRSEFIGNVSHELRTPIFAVQGYLETLLDGAVDDISVRDDFLRKAHHNVLRLHSLLTDLIEISRIESGDMRMSMRYFDAIDFIRGIVEELRPTAEMHGVQLRFDCDDTEYDGIQVLGDRDRLKQVIVNLSENAIKYNRPGGDVTIRLECARDMVTVRVIDTGIGIPEEDLTRIFERFYRVDRDRSRLVGGSGLGLAIVKHILEKHGTRIDVKSKVGEGTEFSFTLRR